MPRGPLGPNPHRSDSGGVRIRLKAAKRRIAFKVSHHRLPAGLSISSADDEWTPAKDLDLDEQANRRAAAVGKRGKSKKR